MGLTKEGSGLLVTGVGLGAALVYLKEHRPNLYETFCDLDSKLTEAVEPVLNRYTKNRLVKSFLDKHWRFHMHLVERSPSEVLRIKAIESRMKWSPALGY